MAQENTPKQAAVDFSNIDWSSQPAVLYCRQQSNIRLSENNTVAQRVNHVDDGVVMTAEPVPFGTMFRITVLEKVEGLVEGLVSTSMVDREFSFRSFIARSTAAVFLHRRWSVDHLDLQQNNQSP